jgi:protein O-GlcNAc transferase
MNQNALAKRAFFLKQFDASVSHELVLRALDKLADLRDASFYFQKAEEHRLKNEFALAISYYERALKIDDTHKDALFYLGLCYLGVSDDTTGEEITDDVQISEDEREKRAALEYRKLITLLRKEATQSFYLCAAYQNRSAALSRQGKYNEALDCCYHALQIRENYAPIHRRLALLKLDMGLKSEALKDCKHALEIDSQSARSHNALGLIHSAMGNTEQAIESFLEAIECNQLCIFPYMNLSEEYRYQKRYRQAIAILDDAIALNPQYAGFYYYHALTDDEMGNEEDAAIHYRRFLEQVPVKVVSFRDKIENAHKRLRELQKPIA